ncbi:MAG: MBOAT family protein, partial [Oscillospiraceae bacterium]|nr:MBOAT family protein [Oscillospiraceae bacterium]
MKNAVLVVCSLFFYSWGEVRYFPIMLASTVVDYTCSRMIESHREKKNICRFWMGVSLLFNLGSLGFFKYTNFFVENINALFGTDFGGINLVLPLGISFYTFQTLSYTIDVYRGKTKAERNIINFAAFVTLFPQLIAGPIVKYTDISRELRERKVDLAQINDGIMLFIFGLGKKVLIANNVGSLWDQVQALG